jgi:hypothetical protein
MCRTSIGFLSHGPGLTQPPTGNASKKRIDGAHRRLFKKGGPIPPLIVTSYTSLLRTIIGDIHRITYVDWKFSDYEAIPASGDIDYNWDESDGMKDRHA